MARILVVDDESLIRVLVADVGESLGHEVLTAASIKEGQDLAQRAWTSYCWMYCSRTGTGSPMWRPFHNSRAVRM